ncbi:MAG TPA: high-potential iron-sulfur protein [Acidiphilium sp.]
MSDVKPSETRRAVLKKAAGLSAAIAVAGMVTARTAEAGGMSPASVKYQTSPKDGHQCDGCALFVPGASASANGTCKAVSGPISPKGWCTLWTAKAG